jgi:serine/threonine protein kinase
MEPLEVRRRAFEEWKCAPLGEVLGSGKYATVRRSGSCAAKVMDLSGKSKRSRMQAYREHVVSIMQTILLLRGVTEHYPFHNGLTTSVSDAGMSLTMFMERFEGNLLDVADRVLLDAEDWAHLAFQVLHACACMAAVFGVVHNDLYPRNVLVRVFPEGRNVCARVDGVSYAYCRTFLAVVADYGIASGKLVGAHSVPEVCASTVKVERWRHFSLQPPEAHILQYEPTLPAFSRDPYTVLKWIFHGQESLPRAPLSVRLWVLEALQRIDRGLEDFHEERSQLPLFHHLFHSANLRRFGLKPFLSGEAAEKLPACVLKLEDEKDMVLKATEALRELGRDESEWALALKNFREHQRES